MTPEQSQLFKRLSEHATTMHNVQIAQDILLVLNDAARYWHLRDKSSPESCSFFLATTEMLEGFMDPAYINRQIDADMASMEATKARWA